MNLNINAGNFTSELPLDVIPNILRNVSIRDFPAVALVCQKWKEILDDKSFQENLTEINGPRRWNEYTNGDVGEAPPLPKEFFKLMRKGDYMLTFIPEEVKIKTEDGMDIIVPIDSLKNIGELFAKTINGRQISFSKNSWSAALQEKRPPRKGYWVLISKNALGRSKNYDGQVKEAKDKGAKVSDLIDTVISLFMEYLRTGEKYFIWDPPQNGLRTWVRVNDQTQNLRLGLGFVASGLDVGRCTDDDTPDCLAFAPARKSIET